MTPLGFQCWFDSRGDIHCADGVVAQPKTGVRIAVGAGGRFSAATLADVAGEDVTAVRAVRGATFVGGSGRNVFSEGLVAGLSSGESPVGFFRPMAPGGWQAGRFVLTVTGPSAAEISDGTDVVAELTTGGTAPAGDFDSTLYGETNYNAAAAFTLAVTAEGDSVGIPAASVLVNAGSAQGGDFTAVDEVTWASDVDADWTIVVAADGSAEMLYLTDVVAERAAGPKADPSGRYVATALGMGDYNLTAEAPVDGEAWQAIVRLVGKTPRVGYVYLEIIEVAGELSEVNGPFFADVIPSPAADTFYLRIAYSDGVDIEQDHVGLVIWP